MSNTHEKEALQALMLDPLRLFVPQLDSVIVEDGIEYLKIANLLSQFEMPNVMDCKIGCRFARCYRL